jgi:hypothetical protein
MLIHFLQVSYLDTGLSSTYFTETEQLLVTPNGSSPSSINSSNNPQTTTPRNNRRYKTQLRDFLSTCRSKRKAQNVTNIPPTTPVNTGSSPVVDYIPDPAAVAAAYSNLTPMYSSSPVPYGASTENLYMTQSIHSGSFYPTAENLFHQYRLQSGYPYPEYHPHHHPHHTSSPYVANGFLPYDSYGLTSSVVNTKEEKWHDDKYYSNSSSSDLTHSTNGRQNFNYDAPSSQVCCYKIRRIITFFNTLNWWTPDKKNNVLNNDVCVVFFVFFILGNSLAHQQEDT